MRLLKLLLVFVFFASFIVPKDEPRVELIYDFYLANIEHKRFSKSEWESFSYRERMNAFYQTYFVTTSGSSGNNGLTEGNAWSLEHADGNVLAGDLVHVKAGLYAGVNFYTTRDGTASNYIKFIGYKNTPGDVNSGVAGSFSTFSIGDTVDAAEMPLIRENRSGDIGSGWGIRLEGTNYMHIENFQIQYYNTGIYATNSTGLVLKNVISSEQGDFSQANSCNTGGGAPGSCFNNNTGNAFILSFCDDLEMYNSYGENSGAQIFTINNSNNALTNGVTTFGNDLGQTFWNTPDYYFGIYGGTTNSTFLNTHVKRTQGIRHLGHGIVLKDDPAITGNTINGFLIEGTWMELQWPDTTNNTIINGTIQKDGSGSAECGFRLANGSRGNRFENILVKQGQVQYSDWDDGLAGDTATYTTKDNVFINVHFNGENATAEKPAIDFYNFKNETTSGEPHFENWLRPVTNDKYYNCTFRNYTNMFRVGRVNSGTEFYNCDFNNISTYKILHYSRDYEPSPAGDKNNFFNTYSGNQMANPLGIDPSYDVDGNPTASGLLTSGVTTPYVAAPTIIGAGAQGYTTASGSASPTCSDGAQNGSETGIDCGGGCTPCNVKKSKIFGIGF